MSLVPPRSWGPETPILEDTRPDAYMVSPLNFDVGCCGLSADPPKNETEKPTLRDPPLPRRTPTVNHSKQARLARTNSEMHCFWAVVARGKLEIRAKVRWRSAQLFPVPRPGREQFRANRRHRIAEGR